MAPKRASSLRSRGDTQPKDYSKPVRISQFSPSPIRKASTGSRGANPTMGTSVRQFAAVHQAAGPLNAAISQAASASVKSVGAHQ